MTNTCQYLALENCSLSRNRISWLHDSSPLQAGHQAALFNFVIEVFHVSGKILLESGKRKLFVHMGAN